MGGSSGKASRRTLTPAVLASAIFALACAAIAVTFVAARGGLQLPVAPAASHVAVGSPSASAPGQTPGFPPTLSPPSPSPSPSRSSGPSESPLAPTIAPTGSPAATRAGTPDPLTALPACAGHPGCYEYTVKRGDTLSGVASRYAIPVSTVRALNPELDAAGTIVVGHILYLGREPYLRLDECADVAGCFLYVVRPGDSLSTIAARFGLSVDAILDANPGIPNANTIYSGQVIRLQYPVV